MATAVAEAHADAAQLVAVLAELEELGVAVTWAEN
jgi:hypothetical protein